MACYPLTELPKAYKIAAQQVDGTDATAVRRLASAAVERIRAGEGPQFIEAHTVRWPGSESNWPVVPIRTSVGLAWDASAAPEPAREWYRSSDPVLIFVRDLVANGLARKEELAQIERNAIAIIDEAAAFALASPHPKPEEALADVFA
jgi:TPP-dependent pyruvate/acetoin dehydrogenase alpha subunit